MQGDESLRLVTLFLRLSGTPRRLHEESCDIGIPFKNNNGLARN